jgi:hypothetical protein
MLCLFPSRNRGILPPLKLRRGKPWLKLNRSGRAERSLRTATKVKAGHQIVVPWFEDTPQEARRPGDEWMNNRSKSRCLGGSVGPIALGINQVVNVQACRSVTVLCDCFLPWFAVFSVAITIDDAPANMLAIISQNRAHCVNDTPVA